MFSCDLCCTSSKHISYRTKQSFVNILHMFFLFPKILLNFWKPYVCLLAKNKKRLKCHKFDVCGTFTIPPSAINRTHLHLHKGGSNRLVNFYWRDSETLSTVCKLNIVFFYPSVNLHNICKHLRSAHKLTVPRLAQTIGIVHQIRYGICI